MNFDVSTIDSMPFGNPVYALKASGHKVFLDQRVLKHEK